MAWLQPKPLPPGAGNDALDERLETALRADDPHEALVAVVRRLFAAGFDEGEALGVFERCRGRLREQGRGTDEDEVADVMDRLVGWCAPNAILRRHAGPDSPPPQEPGQPGQS